MKKEPAHRSNLWLPAKRGIFILLLAGSFAVLAACSNSLDSNSATPEGSSMPNMGENMEGMPGVDPSSTNTGNDRPGGEDGGIEAASVPFEVLTGSQFTLTAQASELAIDEKTTKEVWTFNGTVPGPQIRIKQGETVEAVLKNELSEPVSIHWHGLPVPNSMDGVPGVTMNAVQPGESFTYRFEAQVPGTYWYHSHQDSVNQVDRGLYGSLVVEPAQDTPVDRDYTVVLDEWTSQDSEEENGNSGHYMGNMNMGGIGQPGTNMGGMMSEFEMMVQMYDIFTVNGKSGGAISPLYVREGNTVRIRLVNAGFLSHQLHLQGHEFKIISSDGQPINNPGTVNEQLLNIAPGERYDIVFEANNPGAWFLDEHSPYPGAKSLAIPILYEGYEKVQTKRDSSRQALPVIDITQYGETSSSQFSLNDTYDVEYTMDLGTAMGSGGWMFTINGKTFPETEPINVKQGDLVKVKLTNTSHMDVHPMHLHGHFFQILSKNGQPVTGSPLVKDTLNILPGEEYVVAFKADNPGDWMFHCHDLSHAASGMVTEVMYENFTPDFTPDPSAGNKPE